MATITIKESWKVLQDTLEINKAAITKLKDGWRSSKSKLVPFFDENGQIIHQETAFCCPEEGTENMATLSAYDYIKSIRTNSQNAKDQKTTALRIFSAMPFKQFMADELISNKIKDKQTTLTSFIQKHIIDTSETPETQHLISELNPSPYTAKKASEIAATIISAFIENQNATTVLSINPLDIIFASECTTGWSSCLGLNKEIRTGTVSNIINDPIAIAFAYCSYTKYGNLTMPKKIWRQWVYLFLQKGTAFFQRQYPKENHTCYKMSRQLAAKVIAAATGSEYKWKKAAEDSNNYIDGENAWGYKDPSCHSITLHKFYGNQQEFFLQNKDIPCLNCGITRTDTVRNRFMCPACNKQHICSFCGNEYNDKLTAVDNLYLCDSCLDDECYTCSNCSDLVLIQHSIEGPDRREYCEECWGLNFFECHSCNTIHSIADRVRTLCSECYKGETTANENRTV